MKAGVAPNGFVTALWRSGACLCGICGRDVVAPGEPAASKGAAPTLDHVIPRSIRVADVPRIVALKALNVGLSRQRKVIAHWRCNHAKGNRAPTACEVIFLMAVNARLGIDGQPPPMAAGRARSLRLPAAKLATLEVEMNWGLAP